MYPMRGPAKFVLFFLFNDHQVTLANLLKICPLSKKIRYHERKRKNCLLTTDDEDRET